MRSAHFVIILLISIQLALFGCALGKKEWPEARESDDEFKLELVIGDRQDTCLLLELEVLGAVDRIYRASVQYEKVGGDDGGCSGCPFVPREAAHFTRNSDQFQMNGNMLSLSVCNLEPDATYRFRVAGKSELPTSPLVYTDVYITTP